MGEKNGDGEILMWLLPGVWEKWNGPNQGQRSWGLKKGKDSRKMSYW